MKNFYHLQNKVAGLSCFILILFGLFSEIHAQSFSQNGINFNGKGSINNGTSLTFGPDGRLYVTEYTGSIKIFTIERIGPGNYSVLSMEELKGIQSIQDHNDDGTLHSSQFRETIGLAVTGTAANPVIYVSSSDFRIGGGGGGGSGDVGLDTNSGIITRYSWNGSSWDEVDIVRGLPRSEENHATNGIEFATINGIDYLIVAQGGHTNGGAPSANFAYTTEYALSAAILSINLTAIEAMPVQEDNGRKYIYDLPTLDDPSRPNKNGITDPDAPGYDGIDINDPFGGNDGLNQAIIVPGGPVQIFSPGYRNAYDLVVTQSGAVYVTDNGANGGWGGFPVNEGGGNANNDYDPNEPGSTSPSGGEQINNKDHLSLVTLDMQNYTFGSFYGGHPTPVRANPYGAGLYTNPAITGTQGAVFRTQIYDPDGSRPGSTTNPSMGLPANWPPVQTANPVEGDYRSPGDPNPDGPVDKLVTIWGTNTNGIDEYKASNFEGAMKGDLIAGVNTGELRRVELNPDGSLKKLTPSFASGIGGDALGITCNGDNDIFPGTIWVATLNGKLVVLEPQDFGICLQPGEIGYDPIADYDHDGYTNQDEIDNGTDPCNGGSQPSDHDKAAGAPFISNLNDPDDDNDGIPDADDPFQLGDPLKGGSDAFNLPVINELFSSNPNLQGYMGLGMTGLMNNGDPNPNWLNWLDRRDDPNDPNPNDILGGAIGAMTIHMTSGTALGIANTQEKGFQYGVQVSAATGKFTVSGGIMNLNAPLQLYGHPDTPTGELGFFIGDGTQSNYIKFVITKTGLLALQEINDIPSTPVQLEIPTAQRPDAGVTFFFVVEPSNGEIILEYSFDNGPRNNVGTIVAQGAVLDAIKLSDQDLAVGFIGTSNAAGVELEGTWDYLNVTTGNPAIVQQIENIERQPGSASEVLNLNNYFFDDKGVENLIYTIIENTNPAFNPVIENNLLTINFPSFPALSTITIRATDADNNFVDQSFTVSIIEAPSVIYRVNAGGPLITSIDGEIDWGADSTQENSPYLAVSGTNTAAGFTMSGYDPGVDQSTTPLTIYGTERYDGNSGPPNMTYSFPVDQGGRYEVRLYFGNGYGGTAAAGSRIFSVMVEGVIPPQLNNIDLIALFGHQTGGTISHFVDVQDGLLEISFIHVVENPLINGIEILRAGDAGNPIVVAQVPNQVNVEGDELDGSLVVQASGGDGNLVYSMTGAPQGIVIEPTNGQIGGTIAAGSSILNPYTVQVTVDDSDEFDGDAVSVSFNWTVTAGEPFIVEVLPDISRFTGDEADIINLDEYFNDDKGIGNLTYTIEENTNLEINAVIAGNLLTISYPSSPGIANITIRAADSDALFAEQTFKVTVREKSLVLYRVNAGGPAISAIDENMDWGADSTQGNSPYLAISGSNTASQFTMTGYDQGVDQSTTPLTIYGSERYDANAGPPNMTYSFPVDQIGRYEVRLYFGNGFDGTATAGTRIFNVAVEGVVPPQLNNIDLSALFGHKTGGTISHFVDVNDGMLDISFIHVVENPLINGIEILGSSSVENAIQITQIPNQSNYEGDVLDSTLKVSATGGDGPLVYSMTGAPAGVEIHTSTGVISGTIGLNTVSASPYTVFITVDDSDDQTADAATSSFKWTVSSNAAPSVAITSPLEKAVFTTPVDITIDATASDTDGTIAKVEFLQGTTKLGEDLDGGNGWSYSWNNVPAGTYSLTAVATDDKGAVTTSGAVNINVSNPVNSAPSVAITSPLENALFTTPVDITIDATASDTDGTIAKVEFFQGATKLGEDLDGSNGWSYVWINVPAGTYSLTAVATDDKGAATTSAAVNVTVLNPPSPVITSFSPTSGPIGTLVTINGSNFANATSVTFGPAIAQIISNTDTKIEALVPYVNGKLPSRVKISVTTTGGNNTSAERFTITSGTLPVNASPIIAINSPANNANFIAPASIDITASASDPDGSVAKVEFFNGNAKLGEDLTSPYAFTWNNVATGNYSLTAKATDDKGAVTTSAAVNISVSSSDNTAPAVVITSPGNNSNFTAPASIGITASASDPDGTVVKVEFFNGSAKLGEDLTSPYAFTWNNVATGNYSLTAKATDDKGAVSTSASVNINVGSASALEAPSNLLAQWTSSSQVNLNWQDNSFDEEGFVLERASKADFTGKVDIINLSANTISYQDSNLNNKRAIYYRIKAVRGNLSSPYSNVASPITSSLTNKEAVSVSATAVLEEPEELILKESFVVYPNPSSGQSIIQFTLREAGSYTVNLFNIQGAFITKLGEGTTEASVLVSINFDGNNLANGIYLIKLSSIEGTKTYRFLLAR